MAKKDKEKAENEEPKEEGKEAESAKEEGAEGAEGEAAEGGEGGSKLTKKRIILAGGAALLLLVISLAAVFFMGMGKSDGDHAEEGKEKPKVSAPGATYYDLGEFLVNLNSTGKQVSFLKMKVTVELPDEETKAMVEAKLPRIKDTFQVYLRELRPSDLQGSAGLQRLREELVLRLNKILHPLKVSDVLFSEIIVQ